MKFNKYFKDMLHYFKTSYVNWRGFHTTDRIVVFESDDWGAIRVPSHKTFENLTECGDDPSSDPFLTYDSLESEHDLKVLMSILLKYKDLYGNNPCFTANFAMANPDFENIDYNKGFYKYETFTDTYNRYYGQNHIIELVKQGIENKCFIPQLHTREHLNVERWMRDLRSGKEDAIMAFNNNMIGIGKSFCPSNYFGYMDAFNYDEEYEVERLKKIIFEAIEIFNNAFGYSPSSIVPPCFVWDDNIEKIIQESGISHIQTQDWQNDYSASTGTAHNKRKLHYTGEYNKKRALYYSVRNCTFEPSISKNAEWSINNCMKEISKSFRFSKPAVINTHRLNYIGGIDVSNRDRGIKALDKLLSHILTEYPDVHFLTSFDLLKLFKKGS